MVCREAAASRPSARADPGTGACATKLRERPCRIDALPTRAATAASDGGVDDGGVDDGVAWTTVAWMMVVGLMLAGVLLDSLACGVLSLAGALTLFVVLYRSL